MDYKTGFRAIRSGGCLKIGVVAEHTLFIEFLHLYAFISVPPISVNTIVLSLATVTYSTRLPQSVSSKSETASGSFSSCLF